VTDERKSRQSLKRLALEDRHMAHRTAYQKQNQLHSAGGEGRRDIERNRSSRNWYLGEARDTSRGGLKKLFSRQAADPRETGRGKRKKRDNQEDKQRRGEEKENSEGGKEADFWSSYVLSPTGTPYLAVMYNSSEKKATES